jgi:hypothetical protein
MIPSSFLSGKLDNLTRNEAGVVPQLRDGSGLAELSAEHGTDYEKTVQPVATSRDYLQVIRAVDPKAARIGRDQFC